MILPPQFFAQFQVYQVVNDEAFPNQYMTPQSTHFEQENLPINVGFPSNPDGILIAKWQYNAYTADQFTMEINGQPPSGLKKIGIVQYQISQNKVGLSFHSGDFLPCTEEDLGLRAPTSNLADYGGSVIITSPLYPQIYPDSSDCHWDFQTANPANRIRITNLEWLVSSF